MQHLIDLTLEQIGVIVVAVAAFLGVIYGAFKIVLAAGRLSERVAGLVGSVEALTAALIAHEKASSEREDQNSDKIEALAERVAAIEGALGR